jgi:hypothetical protein
VILTFNNEELVEKFKASWTRAGAAGQEGNLLVRLLRLFQMLASKREFLQGYPEFSVRFSDFCEQLDRGDAGLMEDALAMVYCYLHSADRAYSDSERQEIDAAGGYWCHAGGLSPLLRAGPYINARTRLVDYGAGNGLQGLLFQHLYPHEETVQIELSRQMIEKGKRLQSLMGIPEGKVTWLQSNVIDVPPKDFDFIYIYRSLRPEGSQGQAFYKNFSRALDEVPHPVTIFSIADCLKDFLSDCFSIFYDDGHLTCFSNEDFHGLGSGP